MNDLWLIEERAWSRVERLRASDVKLSDIQARMFADRQESSVPDILRLEGKTAHIDVHGVLTKEPDWILQFFGMGNTAYSEVEQAIAIAESDNRVERVQFHYDSPGGEVAGLFDMLEALDGMKKPKSATAELAASAAYAMASKSGQIEATGPAATFGSIGVVASYYASDRVIDITNTASPDKRPDVKTEEGRDVIRAHLDEIYSLFADAIASGRGTTQQAVSDGFGGGRVFLASEAQRRGMIDAIARRGGGETTKAAASAGKEKPKTMDLATLKAEHPALFAQVFDQGKEAGAAEFHQLACDHFELADACGDSAIAIAAIKEKKPVASVQAKYMAAAMRKQVAGAHVADDDEAAKALEGAKQGEAQTSAEDAVLRELKAAEAGVEVFK